MSPGPASNHRRPPFDGPSFEVPAVWSPGEEPRPLLNKDDRAMLAIIATVSRYKKGELIYEEGAGAGYIYNIISGVVKSYRLQADRKQPVMGFCSPATSSVWLNKEDM